MSRLKSTFNQKYRQKLMDEQCYEAPWERESAQIDWRQEIVSSLGSCDCCAVMLMFSGFLVETREIHRPDGTMEG